jgi:acetyl-CoA/propionyl-CoA carboxylase biotin carboxyl carrier protein
MTVPGAFDSLIAKLIVTGADRRHALARARRALAEFEVDGMPTVLPFHRALLADPAFTSEPFTVHTRWIETEFAGDIPPWQGDAPGAGAAGPGADGAAGRRERIVVEVGGKRIEVALPAGFGLSGQPQRSAAEPAGPGRRGSRQGRGAGRGRGAADGDTLISPMQGTIVKIVAAEGQRVSAGDTIVVLEAMKMEQPLTAHKDGTVSALGVEIGQTVPAGHAICRLTD